MSDIRQLRNPSRPAPALIPRYGPRLYAFGEYPVPVLSTPRCGQYPAQRGAAMRRDGRANAASGPLLGWALGMCIARGQAQRTAYGVAASNWSWARSRQFV